MGGSSITARLLIKMKVAEVFRPIKGYEGLYEISNHGRVKSMPKTWNRKSGKVFRVKSESEIKIAKVDNGYPRVTFCHGTVRKSFSVHRLVADAFLDNPNNFPVVNHKNSKRDDNYFENLEWTTYSGNAQHAFDSGGRARPKGESNPQSKYSDRDIRIIRKLYEDGHYSQREIGEMFEDNQNNISRIVLRQRWKHI